MDLPLWKWKGEESTRLWTKPKLKRKELNRWNHARGAWRRPYIAFFNRQTWSRWRGSMKPGGWAIKIGLSRISLRKAFLTSSWWRARTTQTIVDLTTGLKVMAKVGTRDLSESLINQSSVMALNSPINMKLCTKDPLGSNNISVRGTRHYISSVTRTNSINFLLHGKMPFRTLSNRLEATRLRGGNKS